jgi:hypothetical protein
VTPLYPTADPDFAALSIETRQVIERGIVGAVAFHGTLTPLQGRVLGALGSSIHALDFDPLHAEPASAEELAAAMVGLPEPTRHRVVQFMMVLELILHPLPLEVAEQVEAYAAALGVRDDLLAVGRDYAEGAFGLALKDLERGGYFHDFDDHGTLEARLHVDRRIAEPFEHFHSDPALLARWEALGALPDGTLGREVWRFYRSRGFDFPGAAGSVAPTLAQHDFVHVLADYGAVMESEIETFALMAAADPDPRGFSWLATVLGVFETGYVPEAAGGVLQADRGHLEVPGMCARLADALRRGRQVRRDLVGQTDFFALAHLPVDTVRAKLNIVPKGSAAVDAGSPGINDEAGYSSWQVEHGDPALQRWRRA